MHHNRFEIRILAKTSSEPNKFVGLLQEIFLQGLDEILRRLRCYGVHRIFFGYHRLTLA